MGGDGPAEADALPHAWATGDRGREDEQWLRRCGLPEGVVAETVVPPEAMEDVPRHGRARPAPRGRRPRSRGRATAAGGLDAGPHAGAPVLPRRGGRRAPERRPRAPRISPNIGLQPHTADPPLAAYLASLERVAARYDSAEVLPAHEYRFSGLADRVRVLLEHHERRADEIAASSTGALRRRCGRSRRSSPGPGLERGHRVHEACSRRRDRRPPPVAPAGGPSDGPERSHGLRAGPVPGGPYGFTNWVRNGESRPNRVWNSAGGEVFNVSWLRRCAKSTVSRSPRPPRARRAPPAR